ncbi:hypothetical protein [Faecalibacterium prausnitzii]|nr:hypothetical protein [Faecalibacterium prausnitzii]
MKKRLLSLLVALCMAVTLLPVSAITAWAEESGSNSTTLRIEYGYPVGSGDNHDTDCSGDGWSYDGTNKVLTLAPENPTTYDLTAIGSIRQDQRSILCSAIIGKNATIKNGNFWNTENPGSSITNYGTITSGSYLMPVINHGTITGGIFTSSVSNESDGTIENGQFGINSFPCTVTNNGNIKGGIFSKKPDGDKVADGYTLNAESPDANTNASIANLSSSSCYIIPNYSHPTSVTILYVFFDTRILFPIDVTFGDTNDTHRLLEDWAPNASHYDDGMGYFSVTFTAPHADADTVTLSMLTRLVIDKAGYPVGTEGGTQNYSGNGWKFENGTLTLESGSYDFSGEENALCPLNPNVQLMVESGATLTGGAFAKEPKGAGTFKTVTLNGTGSITAVNGLASGDWGNKLYVVPNVVPTGANTITASEPIRDINLKAIYGDDVADLYPNQSDLSTILLNVGWLEYQGYIKENTNIVLNQGTYSTLKMADDGTPITTGLARISDGNFHTYFGNGWHSQALSGDPDNVYLESGNYNFLYTDPVNKKNGENLRSVNCGIVNEGSTIEDGVFNTLVANGQPGSTSSKPHEIEGGTFAAGLLYNDGVITGGAFNGKDSILPIGIGLSGNYRSVTVKDGAISKVNDTFPLVPGETVYDLVQGSAWNLYSYAGTVLTVESNVDITNINGQEIGEAFSSIYPNGETDKKVVRFVMPDSDVELNSTKIVVPEPKPEPTPDPTPETYTLTVKGGTFTYNGGEAMTSASVPVDAEVKVTLNQSAVPEGMVFDLWAMDEASLLGNPAVAYNEESFTIPAGSVAKGSTVTVEAQYRDATIESEPSILGTAAIIGVAGAGTAVIVWQGYRIGMELYEKYFQPTPEETAAEQPAPEAPAAAAAS